MPSCFHTCGIGRSPDASCPENLQDPYRLLRSDRCRTFHESGSRGLGSTSPHLCTRLCRRDQGAGGGKSRRGAAGRGAAPAARQKQKDAKAKKDREREEKARKRAEAAAERRAKAAAKAELADIEQKEAKLREGRRALQKQFHLRSV